MSREAAELVERAASGDKDAFMQVATAMLELQEGLAQEAGRAIEALQHELAEARNRLDAMRRQVLRALGEADADKSWSWVLFELNKRRLTEPVEDVARHLRMSGAGAAE